MDEKNLWILTEERPKALIIGKIFEEFAKEMEISCFIDNIRIIPILDNNNNFVSKYKILGLSSPKIKNIFLKIVSGDSSFVDYLVFFKVEEPTKLDEPILCIEETKTDDGESRNTGVYQRATKFVFLDFFYKNSKKIMLYNFQVVQKEKSTDTNIFGTRCLLTLGVNFIGKNILEEIKPFLSIDDFIEQKNKMEGTKNGTSVKLRKVSDKIYITGKLKNGKSWSDPTMGTLSLIGATLRKLGWNGSIFIQEHELSQKYESSTNKFIKICNLLSIDIENFNRKILLKEHILENYWNYEIKGEKLGTIFIHILVENFSEGMSIYENHAGCERGYFITENSEYLAVGKFSNREDYKNGDKNAIIQLPDLVLIDRKNIEIINIEGEMIENIEKGIEQIKTFDDFEKYYIRKYYPEYSIIRTIVLCGGYNNEIENIEVSFLLNANGKMILGIQAPKLFKLALKNLLSYWAS